MENSTLVEALPSLQSVMGKLNSNARGILSEVFEQKQISTAGIIKLLPQKNRKGILFINTVSALSQVFIQYGVVVKYITQQNVSYPKSNGLKISPNPRSILQSPDLPKYLIGYINKKVVISDDVKVKSVNFAEVEKYMQSHFTMDSVYTSTYADDSLIPEVNLYMESIMNHPLLDKEKTYELITSAQLGDLNARDTLLLCNQRLIVYIANKFYKSNAYENTAIEFSDLIQEGNFGLSKAIEKFNLSLNLSLSTYAYWWISQSITRFFQDNHLTMRLPAHVQEKLAKFRKLFSQMEEELQMRPGLNAISSKMGINFKQAFTLDRINSTKETVPIELPSGENEDETINLEDIIEDTGILLPSTVVDRQILKEKIRKCLKLNLKINEYQIIDKRFGLSDNKPLKLREIGDELGVTRERVRQVEEIALRAIKEDNDLVSYSMEYLGRKQVKTSKIPSSVAAVLKRIEMAAKYFGVPVELICDEDIDNFEVARARDMVMFTLWKCDRIPFKAIGNKFGIKDPIVIRRTCFRIERALSEPGATAHDFEFFKKLLKEEIN